MKKQLLSSFLLLSVTTIFAQNARPVSKAAYAIDRRAELKAIDEFSNVLSASSAPYSTPQHSGEKPAQTNTITWMPLCGSMNTYGMTGPQQRPLQYHPALNAVSFIHRKSDTYSVTPSIPSAAQSGIIVAEISPNGGSSWDSTAIWSDANTWARYPQGGIYNPSGNTQLANAYVIGTGEAVDATDFAGSWYASKKLNVLNNTASTLPGAQQFFSAELPPNTNYPANMNRHSWTRNGFQVTDDGIAHALGLIGNDLKGLPEIRGYAVLTGTFNSSTTVFDWKMDSIIPPAVMESNGVAKALNDAQMIWNPSGTIGYVVGIGVLNGATLANRSMQPIIYKMDKTQSSSATWSLMTSIDFNTTFSVVPSHLPLLEVTYPSVDSTALPSTSDFNITIDADNNVHIGIVFMSGYSTHPDSLQYYSRFVSKINPSESYKWQHLPGERPYIYDFAGNGSSPWKMVLVDSISSESPGILTTQSGYFENPWNPSGSNGQKLALDARLMLGRSEDGKYIAFCWAQSDSLFTSNSFKYNNLPDITVRLLKVQDDTKCPKYLMDIGPKNFLSTNDNSVRSRATLHFMSPVIRKLSETTTQFNSYSVSVKLPLTVTNSNPFAQETNNGTWYCDNEVQFKFPVTYCTGIDEYSLMKHQLIIYPNPAKNSARINFSSGAPGKASLTVCNILGRNLVSRQLDLVEGNNEQAFDLSDFASGVYIVNVFTSSGVLSSKLIVE